MGGRLPAEQGPPWVPCGRCEVDMCLVCGSGRQDDEAEEHECQPPEDPALPVE